MAASRVYTLGHSDEWHYHRPGWLQRYVCAILGHVQGSSSPTPAGVCQGFGDPSGGTCKYQDICVRCGAEASVRHPKWRVPKGDLYTVKRRWWYFSAQRSSQNTHPRKRRWFDRNPGEVPCDDCKEYGLPDRMWSYHSPNPFLFSNKRRYCHICAPLRQRAAAGSARPRSSVFHDGCKEHANAQPIINRRAAVMATRAKHAT